jgi:hypothetical protein
MDESDGLDLELTLARNHDDQSLRRRHHASPPCERRAVARRRRPLRSDAEASCAAPP